MTLQLELSEDLRARLRQKAETEGKTEQEVALSMLEDALAAKSADTESQAAPPDHPPATGKVEIAYRKNGLPYFKLPPGTPVVDPVEEWNKLKEEWP